MRSNLTDNFFALSLDLLCIAGTDATFKKVNPAFVRALEYSEAELTAKPFFAFIHPEDIPATQIEFAKLLAGTAVINFENRFCTKNGKYLTLNWTASIDQETGNIFAIGRDLTEQKKLQHKMSQLNATLNSHWMVTRTDANGTILDVQDKFCELSGYTKEELVGKTHRVLNSGVHSKKFFEQMWTTISSGKTWKGTLENRKKMANTILLKL